MGAESVSKKGICNQLKSLLENKIKILLETVLSIVQNA
jgi:hypothetical protein